MLFPANDDTSEKRANLALTRRSVLIAMCSTLSSVCAPGVAMQAASEAHLTESNARVGPVQIALLDSASYFDSPRLEALRTLGAVTIYDRISSEGEAITSLAGMAIAIANPARVPLTAAVLEKADDLKLLVIGTTGKDRVDMAAAARKGISVANVPDYATEAVAEHVFALLLALSKHIREADARVRGGRFATFDEDKTLLGFDLAGKTLGVVGLGRIGTRVAQIGTGFSMSTLAWDRRPKDISGVTQTSLDQLLARSDVVSLHLALTNETAGILNAARLQLMKRTAILINTARAELVDESALFAALRDGGIAGAGLDAVGGVTLSNPLLTLQNVVFSPHVAFYTRESVSNRADFLVQTVRGFLAVARGAS